MTIPRAEHQPVIAESNRANGRWSCAVHRESSNGRSLTLVGGHSAMLIELDRLICHGAASRSRAA
jgi:hypothetical protein